MHITPGHDIDHDPRFLPTLNLKSTSNIMKKALILLPILVFIIACGGNKSSDAEKKSNEPAATNTPAPKSTSEYDPKRGEGKWNASNVNVGASLDAAMAGEGEKIYGVKCQSCHKLTDEKLVGPGWKGVTARRTSEWIMNFITNPDPMITKDPVVQAQLELCLVRMPNQNLNDTEARALLEFMRKNDGVK